MKKLQYTTNDPASSTDYLAGDNTWKTIPGGGGGVPYTGATADVDLGTYSLTADTIGIGTPAGAEKLHIDGGATTTRVKIDADNGVSRILSFRTDDSQRWALRVDGTETGSNSGADFQIRRYNDAGAHIDNPIAINRATGNITTSQNVNGATPTEMSYLSGVTSSLQTQLNAKLTTSKMILGGSGATTALVSGTNYFLAIVGIFIATGSDTLVRTFLREAGTLKSASLFFSTSFTGSLVCTLMVSGVASAMTFTIAGGSAAGVYPPIGSSPLTAVSIAATDYVSLRMVQSGGSGGTIRSSAFTFEI